MASHLVKLPAIVVTLGVVVGLPAQTQPQRNQEFHKMVDQYTSQNHILINADVIVGTGPTQKHGTAAIKIDRNGDTTMHIDVGNSQIAQEFTFRNGTPACKAVSSFMPQLSTPENICGTPVPWFFPLPFLPKLRAALFDIVQGDQIGSSSSFAVRLSNRTPGDRAILSHAWESHLTFDSSQRLAKFSYPISPHPGSRHPIFIDTTYDQYQTFGNTPVPYHIHQSIDGASIFDLTVTSISQEGQ